MQVAKIPSEVLEMEDIPQKRLVLTYDYFKQFCQKHNTELIVINLDSCSPEQESTEDLISIIHCFSSKKAFCMD